MIAIDRADAIVQKNPRIESAEIPKGVFNAAPPLPAEATSTVQMDELIVGSKAMSEQVAARFAEELLRARISLVNQFQGLVSLQKANTEKDASIRIHPGVAAYLDGTERTFLERYGDYFWGALLLGSGLGSIGAGWRGIFHKKEQDDVVEMRRKILALGSEVDGLTSLDQIGQTENEAEAALRAVLELYEEGLLDEAALTAFGMVMDQFRHKAFARRLTIDTGLKRI